MLLHKYIENPEDFESNWDLALWYDEQGQTASALSFYLRCAERAQTELLKYECLLRGALCFQKQGSRNFTVKGLLQHAIAVQPTRPEAYFLLGRHYEREGYDGHWNDCYLISSIGQTVYDRERPELRTDVEYPIGDYGILFEKAVSSWWCGLCDESRELFTNLLLSYPLDENHYASVFNNLKFLQSPLAQYDPFEIYRLYQHDKLKFPFDLSGLINRNYSEAFQDMFVLTMLEGKRSGTYIEIGAGHPQYGNNSFLLENKFNWKGVSIDYNLDLVNNFNEVRKNICIHADATEVDYTKLIQEHFGSNYTSIQNHFGNTNYIDYLQIDCDPPEITYQVLLKIDFNQFKFGVITFEHDYYADTSKLIQHMAHQVLTAYGYTLVVNNVSPDGKRSYEDWWVHPDYVNLEHITEFSQVDNSVKRAKDLFLTK